ncbi:V-type ATP synthase subunit F [Thermococcus waiotapuensis]|uniref:A-type ATP synthase subunit F n=1 Tax=Thermococcus waiotapuensis TaxID=90909 RepID=A0AAE4NWM7_9EURY|nr:V-type ATP synthase subunit F [Thermococcus waiotapuensis]MDV3104652.1 V-type ATP synthase subunit F [Thermococcus waiotapuensis]
MKIAVLGDPDTAIGFKLAGVHEVYSFRSTSMDYERARNKLRELLQREDIGLVLITETLARAVGIPEVKFPIILQIPDKSGSRFGEAQIKEIVRKAIGVELKR